MKALIFIAFVLIVVLATFFINLMWLHRTLSESEEDDFDYDEN